jgi:hypothetical protein
MFTTAFARANAALTGIRVRAIVANPAVSTTTAWYAPAMDACSGFGHKRPSRRPPSLT